MANDNDNALPDAAARRLLEAMSPVDPGADAARRMRTALLGRLDPQPSAEQLLTVSGDGGEWFEPVPGNQVKVLRSDDETMSMLVRLAPGSTFPRHFHPADEETFVVEGETWFGDIHLVAGDYHFAPEGTEHGEVRTETGCLLLIRKASE